MIVEKKNTLQLITLYNDINNISFLVKAAFQSVNFYAEEITKT